jgi:UDP-2-acetamido-2-deoxy-ribo-hexuluronate aminotransferase
MDFIDLRTQYQALRPSIDERIGRVLNHGQYILGPEVAELEAALASYTGAKYCAAVASGTEALLIALMALGIGPGDEVITTPFTFVATVEVIVLVGAKPVLVDVEADTGNIDANRLEAAISDRTRAIIPVGLYGQPADMDAINAMARRHGDIAVIEDAAQSFGAVYRGRRSCNLSAIGCTSFFPSKPLGCYGDGGAIFTDSSDMDKACREIRVHGQSGRYQHTRIGVGGRMDTLQCAILLAKLERFPWELECREALSERYRQQIHAIGARATPLAVRADRRSAWAQFTVLVENRDDVQRKMQSLGIPTAVHYPRPMHQQPAYQPFCGDKTFAVSEELAGKVISLPFSADLTENQLDEVVEALRQATISCKVPQSTA